MRRPQVFPIFIFQTSKLATRVTETLGDAVLVQNCDPHLPPALLVAFLLP